MFVTVDSVEIILCLLCVILLFLCYVVVSGKVVPAEKLSIFKYK